MIEFLKIMLYNIFIEYIKVGDYMDELLSKGKEILKILIGNGFEAYFVGEVVRNQVLQIPIEIVEINTSATPDAIKGIFKSVKVEDVREGIVKVTYYGYEFIISTFKTEEFKDKRNPTKPHYSKNLLDDLSTREFTINSMVMSHSNKITDAYDAVNDIKKKKICLIGNPNIRFADNPLRILRAISIISELNFKLTPGTIKSIKSKRKLLKNVNIDEASFEIKKIFDYKYTKKAYEMFVNLKLHKQFPTLKKGFSYPSNKMFKLNYEEFLIICFLLNKKIDDAYLNQDNQEFIRKVYELAVNNKKGKYKPADLYLHGLDVCLEANKLNNIIRRARNKKRKIVKRYNELPIKSEADIMFTRNDLYEVAKTSLFDADTVMEKIAIEIVSNNIVNTTDQIRSYVKILLNDVDLMAINDFPKEYNKDEIEDFDLKSRLDLDKMAMANNVEDLKENLEHQGQVVRNYTELRLEMLERRLNEQDRLIREKDMYYAKIERENRRRKIKEDVDNLISKNLELLKDLNYLNNSESDKMQLGKELAKVYMNYISDAEDVYSSKEVKNEKD